ncbi:MAG TPA: branched-chain amino acid ABC transporter permease [Anaerolineales bacterium]|nr:branched-chain amino acid ABC transporter permease [Anaerolineales bacterium]
MFVKILDIVLGGLLLGGIYALIAAGLSLQYGVARVLNISHGEFIMLGAFAAWLLYAGAGISPLLSLVICSPILFLLGYALHRTLFRRLKRSSPSQGACEGNSMLASFGLLFIIQNIALIIWGGNLRGYTYLAFPVNLGGAIFAANRLVTLGFAVGIALAFYLVLVRTRLGKAIRAAAQDPKVAASLGVNIDRVLAICFGFGTLMAGVAGLLMSMCYSITPTMGLEYTIISIIVVALGGLGSIPGSFLGGIILGLIGSIVTYIQPGLALAAYYVIFMLLLLVRPTGIMGK